MSDRALILLFAFAVIGVSFGIGWWAKRKAASPQAYFGGTALFGPVAIALSSMAAVASAFALVGVPGLIYSSGNTMVLWMIGSPAFALGYLMLGKKVRAMAEVGPVASLGDISDLRFNKHGGIKALLSVVLFVGCVAYLASQIKACTALFVHLLEWNEWAWGQWVAGFAIFGVLTIYTVMSGEVGGILTQAFQGFIMVVAGLIMTVAFFVMAGGFGPVLEAVSSAGTIASEAGTRTFTPDLLNAWGTLPGSVALAWVVIPVLGVICQPQVITRMYALKNPRDLPKMGLYVTIAHMIVAFMVVAVGYAALYMVARGEIPPLAQPDQAIFVFADHLGLYAQLFVYTAVLAAAMSTSSLFLSLSGGIISRDLPSALRLSISPERQVTVSRVTVFALGIGAIIFALTSGDMVAILGTFGFGALMSATLPVFVIGLLWKGASSQGVFAGLIASLGCNLFAVGVKVVEAIAAPWRFTWPGGLPWYVHAVAITAVVSIAVSLFTRGATGPALDRRVEAVIDL